MKKYMALIDGHPAIFVKMDKDGGQFCYARTHYRGSGVSESDMFASREAVNKAARASRAWREKQGYREGPATRYSAIPINFGK